MELAELVQLEQMAHNHFLLPLEEDGLVRGVEQVLLEEDAGDEVEEQGGSILAGEQELKVGHDDGPVVAVAVAPYLPHEGELVAEKLKDIAVELALTK